jgi:gas vesicle structural protein
MTVTSQRGRYLQGPSSSGLYEILDLILEKGLVIDAWVRISVIGIEILTIEARIVIASVDTYLRYAEAVTQLGLTPAEVHGRPTVLREFAGTVVRDDLRGAVRTTGSRLERDVERTGDVFLYRQPETAVTTVPGVSPVYPAATPVDPGVVPVDPSVTNPQPGVSPVVPAGTGVPEANVGPAVKGPDVPPRGRK